MSAPLSHPMIPMLRTIGRRASARVRLCIPAQVLLLQGLENCLLDDLSQAGARVTIAARPPGIGAGVVLTAKGLDAFGTVIWAHGARFGLAFEELLPLSDVVNARHFAHAHAEYEAAQNARNASLFGPGSPWLQQQG